MKTTDETLSEGRRLRAARSERACGRAIRDAVEAMNNYCLEYKGVFDSPVSENALFAPEVTAILSGLRALLNGPTGRDIDCGHIDAKILAIARTHGLADENGEL